MNLETSLNQLPVFCLTFLFSCLHVYCFYIDNKCNPCRRIAGVTIAPTLTVNVFNPHRHVAGVTIAPILRISESWTLSIEVSSTNKTQWTLARYGAGAFGRWRFGSSWTTRGHLGLPWYDVCLTILWLCLCLPQSLSLCLPQSLSLYLPQSLSGSLCLSLCLTLFVWVSVWLSI